MKGEQINIFDVANQYDRLEAAYKLTEEVWNEMRNGKLERSAIQSAVNLQVNVNRIVWALNQKFYDSDNSEWFSCKDCLPEESGWYLITEYNKQIRDNDVNICEFKIFSHGSRAWMNGGDRVIAWMPLPNVYREDNT